MNNMPPQIKQAKLETLEAIIKEVEGEIWTHHSFDKSFAKDNGINAKLENYLNDLMTTAHATKPLSQI